MGSGASVCLRYRLPRAADRLPRAPRLGRAAKGRLAFLEHARTHSVAAACDRFGIARATFYRWRRRHDPADLRPLEDRPARPRRPRRPTWAPAQAEAVRRARAAHPRWGKDELALGLRGGGVALSVSTVGRILADLERRGLLAGPVAVRKPKDHPVACPGGLVRVDTTHLRPLPGVERRRFTAVDVVSRIAVLGVRATATAGTATAFLDELRARAPFPVKAIQVDGGSEFKAEFEAACAERGIAPFVLPPRSPKLNGRVGRLNRTVREEFWEGYDGPPELPALQAARRAAEHAYNAARPHQALGYLTPAAHLAAHGEDHL